MTKPVIRMVASQGLEDAGFEVIEADCAENALEILKTRADVGVLFTDVNMPGALDGLDVARLVHERWPAIQLVLSLRAWPVGSRSRRRSFRG